MSNLPTSTLVEKQEFNGRKLEVRERQGETFIEITGFAKKEGKKFEEYTRRKQFTEYWGVLEKSYPKCSTLNFTENNNEQFINEHLFVDYMRWLNPKFAVWADKLIYSLLTGETKLLTKELEQKDIQLKIVRKNLTETIINKMKTYKDGYVSLRKYIRERGVELTEKQAWNILLDYGYTEVAEVVVNRTVLVDTNLGRQEAQTGVIEFNSKALDLAFSDFVEKSTTLMDFIEEEE